MTCSPLVGRSIYQPYRVLPLEHVVLEDQQTTLFETVRVAGAVLVPDDSSVMVCACRLVCTIVRLPDLLAYFTVADSVFQLAMSQSHTPYRLWVPLAYVVAPVSESGISWPVPKSTSRRLLPLAAG